MEQGLLLEIGDYKLVSQAKELKNMTLSEFEEKVVTSQGCSTLEEVYDGGEMKECDIAKYEMVNGDGRYELFLAISINIKPTTNEIESGIEYYAYEHNAGYHFIDFVTGYDWAKINEKTKEILTKKSITQRIYGAKRMGNF